MGTLLVSITVDDFLVITILQSVIEVFLKTLARTYAFKWIGRPTDFLGWRVSYHLDCTILLS